MRPADALRLRSPSSDGPPITWGNVKLLLHGNAQPFIDAGPNKLAVCNRRKLCAVSGGKIGFIDTAAQIVLRHNKADWQFGTGSWFISAIINASYTAEAGRIFDTRNGSTGWMVGVQQTTRAPFLVVEGTTYGVGTPASNLLVTASADTVVSFSYDGSVLRCFVDGALSWAYTVSLNIDTGDALFIGNNIAGGNANTSQRLGELLIVKGESVATTSFIPPAAWADTGTVLSSWDPGSYSSVKLNLHGAGSNGGTTFTDTSSAARTISAFGNVQTSTAQARIGSSSMLFDGTGDYLTVPQSSDFAFPDDFSVEMQMRPASTAAQCLLGTYQNSSTGWVQQINVGSKPGRALFNMTGDGPDVDLPAGGLFSANAWTHLAVSRVDSVLMLFLEGECVDMADDSQSAAANIALYIGRFPGYTTNDFSGYMQEVRIIKGEGYPRSFVVQTTAHPDS